MFFLYPLHPYLTTSILYLVGSICFCQMVHGQKLLPNRFQNSHRFPPNVLTVELNEFFESSRTLPVLYGHKGVDALFDSDVFVVDSTKDDANELLVLRLKFTKRRTEAEQALDQDTVDTQLMDLTLKRSPTGQLSASNAGIGMRFINQQLDSFSLFKYLGKPFSYFVKFYDKNRIERLIITEFSEDYDRNIHFDRSGRVLKDIIDPFWGSPLWEKMQQDKEGEKK